MQPVLVSNAPQRASSASDVNLLRCRAQAQLAGYKVVDADSAHSTHGSFAVFSGYYRGPEYYLKLSEQLSVPLLNSPQDSERAMRIRQWAPALGELTAETVFVDQDDQLSEAKELGFPMFVKGQLKSAKERGWESCLVHSSQQLQQLFETSNSLVCRRLLDLKGGQMQANKLPAFREYRFFLYKGQVLGGGYYHCGLDHEGQATGYQTLLRHVYQRLQVPLLAVDVAQTVQGEWIVIEIGDPQFSELEQINRLSYFSQLAQLAHS